MEDNFTKQQGEEIVKSILDMAVNYKNLSVKETTGDKTFIATIIKKESSGNYTIKMNGAIYTNIPSVYGYVYEINEKVECRANQGNMDLLEIITPKITKIDFEVIDNLYSTSVKDALSANMGKVLNESKLSTSTTYAQSDSVGGVANSSRLLQGADTRNTNETPLWYMQKGAPAVLTEFKQVNTLGLSNLFNTTFCQLTTFVIWFNNSGGYPVQIATASVNDGKMAMRCGISDANWSSWHHDSHPVGYIYESTDPTSPASLFGGTWEEFGQGRTLVGRGGEFPTAGATGGAKTVRLTGDNNGNHSHMLGNSGGYQGQVEHSYFVGINASNKLYSPGSGYYTGSGTISSSGGGTPHENMPPYIVVYRWRRTA